MNLVTGKNAAGILSAMVCLFYVGGTFGSIMAAWLSDRYGRKPAVFVGCAITLVGSAALAGSASPAMFIVFRFVVGFG